MRDSETRRELPAEAVVPARLVLSDIAFDALCAQLERPAAPTARLMELMRSRPWPP